MIETKKTSKPLLILLIVFLLGFGGQALLNYSFEQFDQELDQKIEMAAIENQLGQHIIREIYQIQTYYLELAAFPNRHLRKIRLANIEESQQEIQKTIRILNKGGQLTETIDLNLAHTEKLYETIHFRPSENDRYEFLRTGLSLKFEAINQKAHLLSQLLADLESLQEQNSAEISAKLEEIKLQIKLTEPLFHRIKESANTVFYENKKTSLELESLTHQQKLRYTSLQVVLTLGVLLIGLLFFWTLSRNISKNADKMALATDYTQDILFSQENIIVVTNGDQILDVSGGFFNYFKEFPSIEAFSKKYDCICELFVKEDGFIYKFDHENWVEHILANPEKVHKAKINLQGEEYIFRLSAVKSKKYQRYIISLFDITDLESAYRDVEIQKDKALSATKAKGEFLANMSHEIRTPMNAILGFINLLKEKQLDEQSNQYLETIDNSSHSLLGIINDILDFSKIESGKLDLDPVDFNPKKEFSITADLFKAKASEKNQTLMIEIEDTLPETLHSDILRLKQIISNLLSNAIKFTDDYQTVTLSIQYDRESGFLFVSVADQGIGISKEKQQTIFNAFTQAEASTTRKFGGTGLGLAISAKLVEMLGGQLQLISEEGKGSRFFFSIPAQMVQQKVKPVATTNQLTQAGHILLVEDNKTNQLLMTAILKKLQLSFDIANDGLEAIQAFESDTVYDLVLMDENMPNLNGIEATQRIRHAEANNQTARLPIIALTANAMTGDRERFIDAGMDEYLTKPVNLTELITVLNHFLSKKN